MAVLADLTDDEAQFLSDLLDWWSEGYKEAKDMTTDDRSLELDDLMNLTASLDQQAVMCHTIKDKLNVRSAA